MARLPSAGLWQSHRHRGGWWSERDWGSRAPFPGWGLGNSAAEERRRPLSSAALATVFFALVFLFAAGVQGEEAVPAGVIKAKGEGIPIGFHGKGAKLHIPTQESDARYLRRLAAATGADRALNWVRDPCYTNWPGIDCDGDGRVVGIDASGQGLSGWVPSTEGDGSLSLLVELDLRNNSLGGALPELAVPQLTTLYLDDNEFTSMPPRFFANMSKARIISLSNNTRLKQWSLPDLRSLPALWWFQARNAGVSGELTGVLGKSDVLGTLDLADNFLSGPVPETFASHSMQKLDLSNNSLNGTISFIQNLPNAQYILLDNNNFSGTLPDFDEYSLPQVFSVAHNRLTGLLPASMQQFLTSGSVYLSGNMLQGPVPVFAGHQVQTDVTEAARTGSFCRLSPGPCDPDVDALLSIAMALHFPVSLAESWRRDDPCDGWIGVHCSTDKNTGSHRVTGINLSRMFLNGTIHPAFASLRSLVTIALSGNNISGTIPPVLTQLPSLRVLDVSDNVLKGSVPKFGPGVEVWAEGNPGLNVSSVSPPSMSSQKLHLTVVFVVVAMLVFNV